MIHEEIIKLLDEARKQKIGDYSHLKKMKLGSKVIIVNHPRKNYIGKTGEVTNIVLPTKQMLKDLEKRPAKLRESELIINKDGTITIMW